MRAFAEVWAREHCDVSGVGSTHNTLGQFSGNDSLGIVRLLQERTLLVNGGHGVGKATIRNVLHERNRTTELWIADALLCAVGESGALNDGRVRVRPNPTAAATARAEAARRGMPECCSGSAKGRSPESVLVSLLA